jgi:hypothetical protein
MLALSELYRLETQSLVLIPGSMHPSARKSLLAVVPVAVSSRLSMIVIIESGLPLVPLMLAIRHHQGRLRQHPRACGVLSSSSSPFLAHDLQGCP